MNFQAEPLSELGGPLPAEAGQGATNPDSAGHLACGLLSHYATGRALIWDRQLGLRLQIPFSLVLV